MPNAEETLWNCDGVTMENVSANGDYFAMNNKNMKINNFQLSGNYPFDGSENVEIHNAKMLSKMHSGILIMLQYMTLIYQVSILAGILRI